MLNVGVIGAGTWAQNMLRVIESDDSSTLSWICDLSPDALKSAGGQYRSAKCTSDVTEIIDDPVVDAVYIATPPATHASLARQALLGGKHVLVEKPFTTDSREALDLIELAALHERTLMTGHTFLFSPPVRKVKELIESGELGDVFYIDSERVNLGKHQPSGVVWDLAPHDISIVCYWLGMSPVAVTASGRSYRGGNTEDVAFATLEFPNGALAQLHTSWLAPAKLRRTTVSGSKQMVVYDDNAGPEAIRLFDQQVEVRPPETYGEFQLSYRRGDITIPFLEAVEPLRCQWQHFAECIRTGDEPLSDGKSGYRVVKIVEAIHRSIESGQREEIDWSTTPQRVGKTITPPRARFGVPPLGDAFVGATSAPEPQTATKRSGAQTNRAARDHASGSVP